MIALLRRMFARQEWQQVQEKNLRYVAATRAKNELVLIGRAPKAPAAAKEAA